MTIQQCKYILKIAECGSLNEAAKQLFVAQSSLSVCVKQLEQELSIRIFERSGTGVFLTDEGVEFARYARQLVEEHDFVVNRYAEKGSCGRLYVSTQHYDFVADIFAKLVDTLTEPRYRFALREMKTYDVIRETETAYCDVGIIAIKSGDSGVMERYLSKLGLSFTPIFKASPHVYLRREHPLSSQQLITARQLKDFPYVSYEQGEHHSSFFTEEIVNAYCDKHIEISDRASLMNVLLATDCYTIGTGIMPSLLNEGRIVSIPFESADFYTLGYLLRTDRRRSELTDTFISLLETAAHSFR